MSKTQAERASEYRQRKRDATMDKIVTDVCDSVTVKRDVTERDGVTVSCDGLSGIMCEQCVGVEARSKECGRPVKCNIAAVQIPSVTVVRETGNPVDNLCVASYPTKPTFADLPLDVQQSIDRMCFETTGQREGSHSRAAMTERATHYQRMHPSQYSRGASTAREVVA